MSSIRNPSLFARGSGKVETSVIIYTGTNGGVAFPIVRNLLLHTSISHYMFYPGRGRAPNNSDLYLCLSDNYKLFSMGLMTLIGGQPVL